MARTLAVIKSRYEEVAGYELKPFGTYSKDDISQTNTNKSKSKAHGEVFTPLWLVDEMVAKATTSGVNLYHTYKTGGILDMCSGYGAFTIRLMPKFNKHMPTGVLTLLKNRLFMNEFQLISAAKLLYIFGKDINLHIGDSLVLPKDIRH